MSSNFNLQMLNLWIGLFRGEAGLPHDLRDMDYIEKWIELSFQNAAGEIVHPELIVSSKSKFHSLLFEWKTGPNFDDDQLRRYNDLTTQDLVQRAAINPDECKEFNVALVGKEEHASRLDIGLNGYPFPFLVVTATGIRLRTNKFAFEELNAIFDPELAIDFNKAPTRLIPFDAESEHWEIAEVIIPKILEYMLRRLPRFTMDQIGGDCYPGWNMIIPVSYKAKLREKLQTVVSEAANREFRSYFKSAKSLSPTTQSPTWEIAFHPSALPFDKRTAEYKRLARIQEEFIAGLRSGDRQLTMSF